ncbi:MAG: DUF1844 domain-containing protein [Planctomycetota bacterium]|nr:DUF1844 domain-containing protein [Planctomycetota bacterium]
MGDNDWKEKAQREKEELERKFREEERKQFDFPPEVSFVKFVADMAANVLIALGEGENPITGKKEVNLPQAKYAIDIIAMLKDKTRGNLTEEEQSLIDSVLTDLRLRFVEVYNSLLKGAKQ